MGYKMSKIKYVNTIIASALLDISFSKMLQIIVKESNDGRKILEEEQISKYLNDITRISEYDKKNISEENFTSQIISLTYKNELIDPKWLIFTRIEYRDILYISEKYKLNNIKIQEFLRRNRSECESENEQKAQAWVNLAKSSQLSAKGCKEKQRAALKQAGKWIGLQGDDLYRYVMKGDYINKNQAKNAISKLNKISENLYNQYREEFELKLYTQD